MRIIFIKCISLTWFFLQNELLMSMVFCSFHIQYNPEQRYIVIYAKNSLVKWLICVLLGILWSKKTSKNGNSKINTKRSTVMCIVVHCLVFSISYYLFRIPKIRFVKYKLHWSFFGIYIVFYNLRIVSVWNVDVPLATGSIAIRKRTLSLGGLYSAPIERNCLTEGGHWVSRSFKRGHQRSHHSL